MEEIKKVKQNMSKELMDKDRNDELKDEIQKNKNELKEEAKII